MGAYQVSKDDLSTIHGFVFKIGTFTTVDFVDKNGNIQISTQINSISAKGEIAGTYFDANNVQHGFIGTPVR